MNEMNWSDGVDDDDTDGGRQQNGTGPHELRKAFKAKAKRVEELEAKIAELTAKTRSIDVNNILSGLGISDPRIVDLIPESVSPTAEAIGEWVKKYEGIFNITPPAPVNGEGEKTGDGDGKKDNIPQDYRQGVEKTGKIGSPGSTTPPAAQGDVDQFLADLANKGGSFDDLVKAFRGHKTTP